MEYSKAIPTCIYYALFRRAGTNRHHEDDGGKSNKSGPLPLRRFPVVVAILTATVLVATVAVGDWASSSAGNRSGLDGTPFLRVSKRNEGGRIDPSFLSLTPRHDYVPPHLLERRMLQESVSVDGNATCSLECCMGFESEICTAQSDSGWISVLPTAVLILFIVLLLLMSALFSGLTLGVMALDVTGLEIIMAGDDPILAQYARRIYPIRKRGNWLLCTLVLGNVAVNSLLSIFMADFTGGTVGFITSTFLIVIFGEILPQAACSRHGLRVGSATISIVKVFRILLFPFAYPLSLFLDYLLGREIVTTYTTAEMMQIFKIHVQENKIDQDAANAMAGALTYRNITVKEVMTPMERVFMLGVDDKLSFQTIGNIFKTGYSRIPIFEVSRNNVIGLLFVKDLIFVDPDDEVPIRSFIQIFGRSVHVVWPDDTLGDVLAELKKGRSHLAVVRDVNNQNESVDPFYEVKGIITLEDIVERILGDSIVDETDAFVDNKQTLKVDRGETFEWARLRLLDAKIVDEMLSAGEISAVTAHLRTNYSDSFKLLTDSQLTRLISETPVTTFPTATQEVGATLPKDLIYEKGVANDVFTLILSGRVTIFVGEEGFRSDLTSWSVLGKAALDRLSWVPDFTAYVSDGPCRCIQIHRAAFAQAVDASVVERRVSKSNGGMAAPTSDGGFDVMSMGGSAFSAGSSTDGEQVPNRRGSVLKRILQGSGGKAESGNDILQAGKDTYIQYGDGKVETSFHHKSGDGLDGTQEGEDSENESA